MQKCKNILVAGGDSRQIFMAGKLRQAGLQVYLFGFHTIDSHRELLCGRESFQDAAEQADVLILPLPVSRNGQELNAPFAGRHIPLSEILEGVRPHQRVFCGMIRPEFEEALLARGAVVYDYFEREELTVRNAIPTAEGALQIAMEELPVTLHGASCVVTGFGRTAKAIAALFRAVGVHVTVAARKHGDLAWIQAMGCTGIPFSKLAESVGTSDLVINTVPSVVLTGEVLQAMNPDCLVMEIASAPGGIDLDAAQSNGIRVIHASSLPGKVAPKTAGEIISDTIRNILEEEDI